MRLTSAWACCWPNARCARAHRMQTAAKQPGTAWCCFWIWTTSPWSMTLPGMTRATMCCATWPACSNPRCARSAGAARLGGDEFAVVLPGCALARGQAVAEQLRASVQAWEPSYQGRSFTLGASIGVVVLDASLQAVPSVLYAADMACYDAKRAGRNRVETRHASQATASGRMALGAA